MATTKLKRPKNKGTGQLFKNPVLERLTRTHIAIPLVIFTVISAVLIYYGIFEKGFTTPVMIALFFVGVFVFTLVEYIMILCLVDKQLEGSRARSPSNGPFMMVISLPLVHLPLSNIVPRFRRTGSQRSFGGNDPHYPGRDRQ